MGVCKPEENRNNKGFKSIKLKSRKPRSQHSTRKSSISSAASSTVADSTFRCSTPRMSIGDVESSKRRTTRYTYKSNGKNLKIRRKVRARSNKFPAQLSDPEYRKETSSSLETLLKVDSPLFPSCNSILSRQSQTSSRQLNRSYTATPISSRKSIPKLKIATLISSKNLIPELNTAPILTPISSRILIPKSKNVTPISSKVLIPKSNTATPISSRILIPKSKNVTPISSIVLIPKSNTATPISSRILIPKSKNATPISSKVLIPKSKLTTPFPSKILITNKSNTPISPRILSKPHTPSSISSGTSCGLLLPRNAVNNEKYQRRREGNVDVLGYTIRPEANIADSILSNDAFPKQNNKCRTNITKKLKDDENTEKKHFLTRFEDRISNQKKEMFGHAPFDTMISGSTHLDRCRSLQFEYYDKIIDETTKEKYERSYYKTEMPLNTRALNNETISKFSEKKSMNAINELVRSYSLPDLSKTCLKNENPAHASGSVDTTNGVLINNNMTILGLANAIVAFCLTYLKPPWHWTDEIVDTIFEIGDKLYKESVGKVGLNPTNKMQRKYDLKTSFTYNGNTIIFHVSDPQVSGFVQSSDPSTLDLLAGLDMFFDIYNAGILRTNSFNISIWKEKYCFYLFHSSGRHRSDVSYLQHGFPEFTHFKHIKGIVRMLNKFLSYNDKFTISKIKVIKVTTKGTENSTIIRLKNSDYRIINEYKAVINGTFNLNDKCFEHMQTKQALPICVFALSYAQISPSNVWSRDTIDKILILGKQFYSEFNNKRASAMNIEDIPNRFNLGAHTFEVTIYGNYIMGTLRQNPEETNILSFFNGISDFFNKNEHNFALLQYNDSTISIWKQNTMFYLFEPYPRNNEGFRCVNGTACVQMHSTCESMTETFWKNTEDIPGQTRWILHAFKLLYLTKNVSSLPYQSLSVTKSMMVPERAVVYKPAVVDNDEFKMLNGQNSSSEVIVMDKNSNNTFASDMALQCAESNISNKTLEYPKFPEPDIPEIPITEIEQMAKVPRDDNKDISNMLIKKDMEAILTSEYNSEIGSSDSDEILTLDEKLIDKEVVSKCEAQGEEKVKLEISFKRNSDKSQGVINQDTNADHDEPDHKIYEEALNFYDMNKTPFEATTKRIPSPNCFHKSAFIKLADGSEILYGSSNIYRYVHSNYKIEHFVPTVAICALIVSSKYAIDMWDQSIIDIVLSSALQAYRLLRRPFSSLQNHEIPRFHIGSSCYRIAIQYFIDGYLSQLETVLKNKCLTIVDKCIIVAGEYACTVFKKDDWFYLYESFPCNKIGLRTDIRDDTATFTRFTTLRALVARISYNEKCELTNSCTKDIQMFTISQVIVTDVTNSIPKRFKRCAEKYPEKICPIHKSTQFTRTSIAEGTAVENAISAKDQFVLEPVEIPVETPRQKESVVMIDSPEVLKVSKPIGYQLVGNQFKIQGSFAIPERNTFEISMLKPCHFICFFSMLNLVNHNIRKWDTRRIDFVLEQGIEIFEKTESISIAERRKLHSVLLEAYYFDLILKKVPLSYKSKCQSLLIKSLEVIFIKRKYIMLQFPNNCFVIHKNNHFFHLFDPYANNDIPKSTERSFDSCEELEQNLTEIDDSHFDKNTASWILFKNVQSLVQYFKYHISMNNLKNFDFYSFDVTSIRKAPFRVQPIYRLSPAFKAEHSMTLAKDRRNVRPTIPLNEDPSWLDIDIIPWSRTRPLTALGKKRGTSETTWKEYNIEFPNDLYSLWENLQPNSFKFAPVNRGKQVLAICAIAAIFPEYLELNEWNSTILASIVEYGDRYFTETMKTVNDHNREIVITDLLPRFGIVPYEFEFFYDLIISGTLYNLRPMEYNLNRALAFFFDENNYGIFICESKCLAFGKCRDGYFMFDCQSEGPPLFAPYRGGTYVLKCQSLNRLLYCMIITVNIAAHNAKFNLYSVDITNAM